MSLARLYPAGTAMSSVISTTSTPMNIVFPAQRTNSVSLKRTFRFSSVGGWL